MEVNILDYLSTDEIKKICREAVFSSATNQLKSETDLQRILSNASYHAVWQCVDDNFKTDMNKVIAEKIPSIINELGAFSVFRPANAWDRSESVGYKILSDTLKESKPMIEKRVHQLIEQISLETIKEAVVDEIDRVINRLSEKQV